MNRLARLRRVKNDLAGMAASVTVDDDIYGRQLDEVSAEFVQQTGREFAAIHDTRYFHGGVSCDLRRLYVGDVASLQTVKVDEDRDGVFEKTLVENTDFWLGSDETREGWPARELYLMPNGYLSAWPKYRRAVQVVALFGFSYEREPVVGASSHLTGSFADASTLSLTITGDQIAYIDPGDVFVLGDEQVEVISLAYANPTTTVICTRGLNGTTAAAHSDVAIYRRRYPRDVERVVAERVISGRWDSQGGYQGADGGSTNRAAYARWCQAVSDYTNPAGAI